MADLLPTSPNPPGVPGKKELSMEMRLLIAFLLMGLVLFVTPNFNNTPPPAKPVAAPVKAVQTQTPKPAEAPAVVPPPASSPDMPDMPGKLSADKEQEFTVDTDLYRIRFTNRGALVKSWLLKKYKDHAGNPVELVNQAALARVPGPFSLAMKDDKTASLLNFAYFVQRPTEDSLGVDYEFSDGRTLCRKSFKFTKDGYLSQFNSEVTQNGVPMAHLVAWRGGFGDPTVPNREQVQKAVYYDVPAAKLFKKVAKDAKDGAIMASGNYSFAGLDDLFFAFVVLPKDNISTQLSTVRDEVPVNSSGKDEPHVGVEVGGDSQNRFAMYVGPKDVDIVRKVDPKLQQLIDWGWFWFIAQPLFQALHFLNDQFVHNYGWSIVLITVVINLLLLPLRLTSMKSARKMQALAPQIAVINAKYKNLSLRDPKKAEQNQEVMDLYKKHGANPLGGCLPMVIQLPILYAFYTVLTVTIEMRGATWLWVTDLSQAETLAIHVLPIVMILTQFVMQRITPNPTMDPSQARMMQFMPLMFGFFFYSQSSGLVLYWLTGNLVGILQQFVINKYTPAPVIEDVKTQQKKLLKR